MIRTIRIARRCRTSRSAFAFSTITLTSLLFHAAAFADATPVARHGQLAVKGNRIVNQAGDPVVLRGMSLFWSQWMPQFYNPDAVRWLADDWNCSVVRAAIAVRPGGYIENPQLEMKKAETVIQAAIDCGIYVIVDWHAHQPNTQAACEFFAAIAQKYGRHPNIIYETFNEPLKVEWASIKKHHEAVIAAIRKHDPDNLIICGTGEWSQRVDEAADDPVSGENIAYTLHFYAGTHTQWLRDRAEAALARGIALFITECGASEANGNGVLAEDEMRRWWDFAEKHQLSWCCWSLADKDETSAALLPGAAGTGGWNETEISPAGKLIRTELRAHR